MSLDIQFEVCLQLAGVKVLIFPATFLWMKGIKNSSRIQVLIHMFKLSHVC